MCDRNYWKGAVDRIRSMPEEEFEQLLTECGFERVSAEGKDSQARSSNG